MKNGLKWMRLTRYWHARLGVFASLLFLILVITGVMLNHTEALKLDQRPVAASWLMGWYGLENQTPEQGYRLGQGYLVSQSGRWFMDGHLLGKDLPAPVGALEIGGIRYIASPEQLALYQSDGQRVDQLDSSALPATPLTALGQSGKSVLIRSPKGVFASTDGGLNWQAYQGTARWSQPEPLPAGLRQQLAPAFAPHLPLERIMLDLHSERIFGRFGPWLMDLAALILLGLSLSGAWIFWQGTRRP